MVDVPAAASLLLANAVIVLGGLAILRLRERTTATATDEACEICSRTLTDAVADAEYPICERCRHDYLDAGS